MRFWILAITFYWWKIGKIQVYQLVATFKRDNLSPCLLLKVATRGHDSPMAWGTFAPFWLPGTSHPTILMVKNDCSDLDKAYLTLILAPPMFYVPLKRPNSLEKINMPYLGRLLTDFVQIWRADSLSAPVNGLLHGLYHQRSNKGCSGL